MNEYFEALSATACSDLGHQNIMNVTTITENHNKNLYISRFHRIPNWIGLPDINCEKAIAWFSQNYRNEISDCFYAKHYKKRKGMSVCLIYYFLYSDLMVVIDDRNDEVEFYYRKTSSDLVDKIANELRRFKLKMTRRKPEIELLITSIISSPMTLAMVYKQNDAEFVAEKQKKVMGFGRAA
jgi:hypothetical protein